MKKNVNEGDVLLGVARSIDAMKVEAVKLVAALNPDYLPEAVLRDIEAKMRPFTGEIRKFQESLGQLEELIATWHRNLDYEAFWVKPTVGKAIN
jgi:ribosomal protein L30E